MKRYLIGSFITSTIMFAIIVFPIALKQNLTLWQYLIYFVAWLISGIIGAYLNKLLEKGAENARKERKEQWDKLDD